MSKKKLLPLAGLLALIVVVVAAWFVLRPGTFAGSKTVNITVVHSDGTQKEIAVGTDAEYLGGCLREISLVEGEEGAYGLFVTGVDGETANADNEEWWCFTKNGEALMTGVDETPIADGEQYEITFTVGYDF